MKTSCKFLIITALISFFVSCSDDNMRPAFEHPNAKIPILLFASYPTSTRASDAGFEDTDRMGLFVLDYINEKPQSLSDGDVHASNICFIYNEVDNEWRSSTDLYWTSEDTPADFVGYYPYDTDMALNQAYNFSIERRQDQCGSENALGGYEASDFLWAKSKKVMPSDGQVNLTFTHLLAGVRVSLVEGKGFDNGEWSKLEKEIIIPNVRSNVSIEIETGIIGDASGEFISVVPYHVGEDWRAVVVPQTISAGNSIIDITVDGTSYHLTKNENFQYKGSHLNTFTISVDKRGNGNGYDFNLDEEAITAWVDDVEFREGIVRNYIAIDVQEKGSLKSLISGMGISASTITGLKLSGQINEDDFKFLREECSSLKSLNLYEVVVWDGDRENVIPKGAMYEKKTLMHLMFPKYLEIIGSDAFYNTGITGSLIIPEGVVKIGEMPYEPDNFGYSNMNFGVFAQCTNLRGELSLPSTLQFIEDGAFAATNLSGSLMIPESVNTIGNWAFSHCNFTGDLIIPDNVKEIGSNAFERIPFNGSLVLPKNITQINPFTFEKCGFSGILSLPEGIRSIEKYAFEGCGFRGELVLPSSLQRISNRAFSDTKISSIVFPENLSYIGDGAFMNCKYLRGSVSIPKKVMRLNRYLFFGCSQLSELILSENISTMEGAVLYGCNSLNHLVCNNPEPPKVNYLTEDVYGVFEPGGSKIGPFDGLPKNNFTLEVPKEALDAYKRADGWKEFGRISQYSNFVCRPMTVCALNSKHSEQLTINSDGEWEVVEKPDWCSLSKSSGNFKAEVLLTINELSKGSADRCGKIVFKLMGTDITTECTISQFDYQYSEDECVTLQKASKGNGIDILFVGDGWDAAALADGSYMSLVSDQMEAFFGVEPYLSYRDRFNVYACISLSQETGINTASTWRNTRFSTFYAHDCDGNGTLQLDNVDNLFDYAISHSPLKSDKMWQSLVIMTLNSDEYGSSTILTENGSAVALCCPSSDTYPMDTRGIIQHEACGHAFGKLAEERIVKNAYVSNEEKNKISEYQWKGWYQNISLSGKTTDVHWNYFIFDPRYSDAVDVFEGAYGKTRGVYRAEINSCMNYGIPYFSAPARLDIMRRILEYSGEGFTMEKFYETDSDKWGSTGTTRSAMPDACRAYVNSGMHHPVRIVKSKKY